MLFISIALVTSRLACQTTKGVEMEKRKLRRRCNYCGRILDVDNLDIWDDEVYLDTVRWTADPYDSEVWEDYTKMWLCGNCQDNRRDEI